MTTYYSTYEEAIYNLWEAKNAYAEAYHTIDGDGCLLGVDLSIPYALYGHEVGYVPGVTKDSETLAFASINTYIRREEWLDDDLYSEDERTEIIEAIEDLTERLVLATEVIEEAQ